MNLSFYENLNESQKSYAQRIAAKAKQMGVSPELAVSVAFKESGLNPKVQAGGAGEIGIMQIKPDTAKEVGFSAEDIRDPDKNIEAGIKYLKKSLDMSEGDARLAAAGYNAGINHPFFTSKGTALPDITVNYLKDLKSYGAFPIATAAPARTEPAVSSEFEPAQSQDSVEFQKQIDAVREKSARGRGELAGAGAGTALTALRAAPAVAGRAARLLGQAAEEGRLSASPPLGGSMAPNLASEATQANRILQGTTDVDSGATGRARMAGFNVETAQQAARAKEAAQNIGALQRSGVVPQSASQVFAQSPGMTATPSGVLYPRSAPAAKPVPPPPRSGLDEVTKLFRDMIEPGSRMRTIGGTVMKYGAPPLAFAQAGSELGSMASESGKEKPDYMKMGLSGLGATGAVMSAFPPTAPVGIPLAITAPLIQYMRENQSKAPLGQTSETIAP